MAKEVRSAEELSGMLMEELHKHPECKDIERVAITYPEGQSWNVAFVRDGAAPTPAKAFEIARQLQERYDLA